MSDGLWASRIRYDALNRIQYIAKALPGADENALVWSIKLLTYEGATHRIIAEGWPGGDASQRWSFTLRATYAYS